MAGLSIAIRHFVLFAGNAAQLVKKSRLVFSFASGR
jgi:hypothetical protein